MSLQPLPSLPARIGRLEFRYGYSDNCGNNSFNFRGPLALNPGWSTFGFFVACQSWLNLTGLSDVCSDYDFFSFWVFYNDGTTLHSGGSPSFTPGPIPGPALDPAVCSVFTKRSIVVGKHGIGRMFGPAIPKRYIVHGTYDPSYLSVLNLAAVRLLLPVFYNGQNYIPVHHSNALGNYYPYTTITCLPRPGYLYRRRPGRSRTGSPYSYPVVP